MKTKIALCMSMLWLLCNNQLDAQHKMVKLSNFDRAFYRLNGNANGINFWAYTNVTGHVIGGREFAFIGVSGFNYLTPNHGISVIEVTDPLNIREVAFIPSASASQRDFVVYTHSNGKTYLYTTTEGTECGPNTSIDGLRIVDITGIVLPVPVFNEIHASYDIRSFPADQYNIEQFAHNIQLDKVTNRIIVMGMHTCTGFISPGVPVPAGVATILDLNTDPENPAIVTGGALMNGDANNTYYMHDGYFNNNKLYSASIQLDPDNMVDCTDPCIHSNGPLVPGSFPGIHDAGNATDPFSLISSVAYPTNQSPAYPVTTLNHLIHDVSVTADEKVMVTSDEHILGAAIFWDVSNPASPVPYPNYYYGHRPNGNQDTVLQHNHTMKGNDRCYVAHYSNGLWVLDISDPNNVQEIAYYDTYLEHNYGNYNTYTHAFGYQEGHPHRSYYFGAWEAYVDLPSGNILVCDMNNGLYVLNNCVSPALQSGLDLTLGAASYSNQVYGKVATNTITVDPGSGNYTVGADGNVTLTAGTKITIKPGFHAQADGKFHAQIGSMCQNCPTCPPLAPPPAPPHQRKPVVPSKNNVASDKLKCYPNPASTHLNLQVELAASGTVSVAVYDQFGRSVMNVVEDAFTDPGMMQKTIDISALPAGIYTVKLKTAAGTQTSRFTKL